MKQTYEMTMLYDFYGDLLTDRQKEFFNMYYNEDLSLSEIAENAGITRQGVRDVLVRAEATLTEIEDKTGTIARFQQLRQEAEEIQKSAELILNQNRLYQDRQIQREARKIRDAALRIKE